MKYEKDRAWLEISLSAIRENYLAIQKSLPAGVQIITVLKADAYGLGAPPIAAELEKLNAPLFAVATIEEAMALREHGVKTPVMLMGPMNVRHMALAVQNNIELFICDEHNAAESSRAAQALGLRARGHLAFDVGLSRFGITLEGRESEAVADAVRICELPGLEIVAAMSHVTHGTDPELDRHQAGLFTRAAKMLRSARPELKFHLLATEPLLEMPEFTFDFVRVGALVLGISPPDWLKRSVTLKTVICQIKTLASGAHVSYGPEFTTKRETRAAVVSIGYADGMRRSLSNRGFFMLHGKKAPIIGKNCCDFTILDVTEIENAEVGDVVTVLGTDGDLRQGVADFSALYPATPAEVTTNFSVRLPRFYV